MGGEEAEATLWEAQWDVQVGTLDIIVEDLIVQGGTLIGILNLTQGVEIFRSDLFPEDFSLVETEAPEEVLTAEELQQRAATFLQHLSEGEYGAALEQFDETMKDALPEEKLKEMWEGMITSLGPLQSLGDSRVYEEAGYQIVLQPCSFENGKLDAKFVFDKKGHIAGLWFLPPSSDEETHTSPSYAKENKFTEEEIIFGKEGWELPGTLSLPKGEGPFPAVVLVHGSGPNDRDETIGPNKPFKDIAWGLASNGIAILRYDKRTYVHGMKMDPAKITVEEEVIEDALLALDFLRQEEQIDGNRIFLLGHSLGGGLVPEIANRDGDVAGVIVLAGFTRPLHEMTLEQTRYIFSLDGEIDEQEANWLEEIEKGVEAINDHQLEEDEVVPGIGGFARYWYDLQERDAQKEALELSCPLFILQGERDYQVTMEDFKGWQEGLSSKEDVTFKLYPDLNHLFMSGEGKPTPSEYQQPGHVDGEVIEDMIAWIGGVTSAIPATHPSP
jgi:hypothetical protein